MWLFKKINQRLVLLFEPPQLSIALMDISRQPIRVVDNLSVPLDQSELTDGLLFNLSKLHKQIASFINKHSATECYTTIGLACPIITEQFPVSESSTFKSAEKKGQIMTTHYLYPTTQAHFCYLFTSLPYERLFQYQLLARMLSLHTIRITSASLARLFLYKQLHGTSFSQSQLAHDMQQCNNDIQHLALPQLSSVVEVQTDCPLEWCTLAALTGLVQMDV